MATWYGDTGGEVIAGDFDADGDLEAGSGVVCTVWDAPTGGTQITDLIDTASNPITQVTTTSKGRARFGRPADNQPAVWVQTPDGERYLFHPRGGTPGPAGPAGAAGAAGQGVPTGGSTGQVLAKTSNTDYATGWTTPAAGTGGGLGEAAFTHADHTGGVTASYDSVAGEVIFDIPTSDTPQGGRIPVYQDDGNIRVAETPNDDLDAASKAFVVSRTTNGGTTNGTRDVRGLWLPSGTAGTQPATPTDGTFATLPTLGVDDAASGDRVWVDLWMMYRAVAAAGIRIRFKGQSAAVTNRLPDPSFDGATISGWFSHPDVTLSLDASDAMRIDVGPTTAPSVSVWSAWQPLGSVGAGEVYGVAAELRRLSAATGRILRLVLDFGDAASGDTLGAAIASPASPNIIPTTTYARSVLQQSGDATPAAFAAPATATKVRFRVNIIGPVSGDSFLMDKVQLEPGATVPTFGATGGGSSVLAITGGFEGHPGTGTPAENDRYSPVLYPSVANLEHRALGRGATTDAIVRGSFEVIVGGTGLTGQRIEWEIAQHAANATATVVTAGRATFVKMPAA